MADSTHFEVVGASSVGDHGEFAFAELTEALPYVGDQAFIPRINRIIQEHNIDVVYPAHDDVVVALALAINEGELACDAIVPNAAVAELTRSKTATYRELADVIDVPKVFGAGDVDVQDLPIFAKPDRGNGSKGARVIGARAELESVKTSPVELVVTEFLPGAEYTVDCFTDRHGRLRYARARSRDRIVNGIAARSRWVNDARFSDIAEKINGRIELRGAWFFQVKAREGGDLVLLEVAPRIGGTMGLSRCAGVNLPLLSLFDRFDREVEITPNNHVVEVDRALQSSYRLNISFRHIYIDLDDLIIVDGKLNTRALSVVFGAINAGIKVHLLTKHAGDLSETLLKYRISEVFDEIIHIASNDQKWEYISEPESIFIDDSFSERDAVQKNRGIPVFDAHSLEALITERGR